MPGPTDPERTIYLVDGTNNLYRAFFAIRGLTNSKGFPTNAIYGFTMMLRKLIREHAPRYLGVAFDLAEPTFRHLAYADYKANRPESPKDLVVQIPNVRRVCRVLGVPDLEMPGYEADDLIGTLARKASEVGYEVVIVATDKDLLQLVGDGVLVYNPVSEEFLDRAGVERVFGVKPEQVREVLALCGDASDNIPGVPGIGEKGAKALVRQFGDLEAVLRSTAEIERKSYREGLESHADIARLSRDLATVRLDVPIPFDPRALRLGRPDERAARDLFLELEFTALAREFSAPSVTPQGTHHVILGAADLERAVADLRAAGRFAFNLERDRPEPMRASLVGISLARPGGDSFYVPLAHRDISASVQIDRDVALRILRPLLLEPSVERVAHNVKSDLILLRRLGIGIPGAAFDTMLASYLINPSRRSHALEVVAQEVAGLSVASYAGLLGSGAKRRPLEEIPVDRAVPIVCGRVAAILAIRDELGDGLRREGLLPLFSDVELPLASVLAEMEMAGVRLDTRFLAKLSADWEKELARLTGEIHALAGREFNINSPRQLGEILFETLKLKPGRKTQKTRSFSTNMEILEGLAQSHDLPRAVLEYRSLQKLKSSFVDTLPSLINPETGRVHTSFNQAVAATGRLSSSDPNLQNIPIRTEHGRLIRRAFIPEPGHVLLSADYSQIELRVLAHLCGDQALVEAFRKGEDIHRRTAAEIFGVAPELVSDGMRRRAKVVNFGIIYGMGPQRLSREQGITLKEAEDFIGRYFRRFPRVKEFIDATIVAAESEGKVKTLLRRVRYFPEISGTDRNARQQGIRAAVNTPLQGTAADLIKKAMVVMAERLHKAGSKARMTLQVHDELVLEVPEDEVASTPPVVREVMEGIHPLAVPLVVDLRVGRNWLEMDDLPESKD